MPLHVSSTMYSSSGGQNCIIQHLLSSHLYVVVLCTGWEKKRRFYSLPVNRTATYRCDDTRCCIIQFWPPDGEHIVLETCRGIELTYYKTRICALSWLITKIILRCTVSETSIFNAISNPSQDVCLSVLLRGGAVLLTRSLQLGAKCYVAPRLVCLLLLQPNITRISDFNFQV